MERYGLETRLSRDFVCTEFILQMGLTSVSQAPL